MRPCSSHQHRDGDHSLGEIFVPLGGEVMDSEKFFCGVGRRSDGCGEVLFWPPASRTVKPRPASVPYVPASMRLSASLSSAKAIIRRCVIARIFIFFDATSPQASDAPDRKPGRRSQQRVWGDSRLTPAGGEGGIGGPPRWGGAVRAKLLNFFDKGSLMATSLQP